MIIILWEVETFIYSQQSLKPQAFYSKHNSNTKSWNKLRISSCTHQKHMSVSTFHKQRVRWCSLFNLITPETLCQRKESFNWKQTDLLFPVCYFLLLLFTFSHQLSIPDSFYIRRKFWKYYYCCLYSFWLLSVLAHLWLCLKS